MKKALLASVSIAVLLSAADVLAREYTGTESHTGSADNHLWIEADSKINNADFDVKMSGSGVTDASRIVIGQYDTDNTLTFLGKNTVSEMLTFEPNTGKTTIVSEGDTPASLTVKGYMTFSKETDYDLSALDVNIEKGPETSSMTKGEGELVIDNGVLKVGNLNFADGTGIFLFNNAGVDEAESSLTIAGSKTLTLAGNNYVKGSAEKTTLNINGEAGSKIVSNGNVNFEKDTSIDGADVEINAGRYQINDNTLTLDNNNVTLTGSTDGNWHGIIGGNGLDQGKVIFEEGVKTVTLSEGAAVSAKNVDLNGGTYNVSGAMSVFNPDNNDEPWRAGSMIAAGENLTVGEKAAVTLGEGGQLVVDDNGTMDINGTVNLDGGFIRGSSLEDGSKPSTVNIAGVVNAYSGEIASRQTEVNEGGVINVNGTLDLTADKRAEMSDKKGKLNINAGGKLVNNGTVNVGEEMVVTIHGAEKAIDDADQKAGGSYVADNSTFNGDLTLASKFTEGDAALTAAAKAEFTGNNTITGNLDNYGVVTVKDGASLTVGGDFSNTGYVDVYGQVNSEINSGNVAVKSNNAKIKALTGAEELAIDASTAVSGLLADASDVNQVYVSAGNTFDLDDDKLTINKVLNTHGTTNLGTDYSVTRAKVAEAGTLNLNSHALTADVDLWKNANLVFNVDKTASEGVEQAGGQIKGNLKLEQSANLKPVVDIDAGNGTYQYVSGDVSVNEAENPTLALVADNMLYDIALADDNKTLNISKKSSGEIAQNVVAAGGTVNNAATVAAWLGGDTAKLNGASHAVAEHLNNLAQTNPQMATAAATALAPETAAQVQANTHQQVNQLYSAVGTRLSGGSLASAAQGKSSGDGVFERAAVWVQGLFNKSKLDDTRKSKGFDADSTGIAFGAEKFVNDDVKVGLGYAYTDTDIDGFMRKTDADTHTALFYGEYKPSDWYVNAIASYGWSDYSEKKNVGGLQVKGDYDVDVFGLQAMTGYDMKLGTADFTPEVGLRYVNIKQDAYRDSAGQKVGKNSSDILTAVVGAKVNKDFALDNGMNLRPEARVAMTYDMVNDDTSSAVTLANGSGYVVNGDALDRLGWELGAGLTAEVNDQVELSVGYEGRFRDHYEDHTGLLNAKYKF